MSRFKVFAGTNQIGTSELESSDPTMGVASGTFRPLPAYDALRSIVVAARNCSQAHLALSVRTGEELPVPALGVQIDDYTSELGSEGTAIHVFGIPYPLYGQLFLSRGPY